jgi:Sulfotransferase family
LSFENRYSALDRAMHLLAFASPGGQRIVAELEDQVFASQLDAIEIARPVFVTSLPRAGTTLLLEILSSTDEFASHSYRNMPFVLCPLFWDRISFRFQRRGELQERAHQDGMLVGADSPEAFEEMLWMAFWKSNYARDRILPWLEADPEFFEFMRSHMRKIIALAGSKEGGTRRYLSKNNLNIARIPILYKEFSDAIFLVPFRDPLEHASSLLRQHINFLKVHREDRFARRYMAGIGHFDFGANFRAVDFGGWLGRARHKDHETLSFWLEYWIAAYEHLAKSSVISLLCFEDMCAEPVRALGRLAQVLGLQNEAKLAGQASRFRMPRKHSVDVDDASAPLVERAEELYQSLRQKSMNLVE